MRDISSSATPRMAQQPQSTPPAPDLNFILTVPGEGIWTRKVHPWCAIQDLFNGVWKTHTGAGTIEGALPSPPMAHCRILIKETQFHGMSEQRFDHLADRGNVNATLITHWNAKIVHGVDNKEVSVSIPFTANIKYLKMAAMRPLNLTGSSEEYGLVGNGHWCRNPYPNLNNAFETTAQGQTVLRIVERQA